MPYRSNRELPEPVKDALPTNAQSIFRNAFNSADEGGLSEQRAMQIAWGAVKNAGYEKEDGKWVKKGVMFNDFYKGDKTPLYVSRRVKNADDIMDRAKSQGFESVVNKDDLHVTIAFSREPVARSAVKRDGSRLTVIGGNRAIEPLGDDGAIVLKIESDALQKRWREFIGAGASWDYESYQPHVTITYSGGDIDLDKVEPYGGDIVFLGEKYEDLDLDWKDKVIEKAEYQGREVELNKPFRAPGESRKFAVYVQDGDKVKIVRFGDPDMEIKRDDPDARANFRARHRCDEQKDKTTAAYWSCRMWESGETVSELTKGDEMSDVQFNAEIHKADDDKRLVYAWASVVTKGGEPVADLQGDIISIGELEKAAHGFMLNSREAGEMHIRTTGIGKIVESVVLSKQLQDALGIDLGQEGWFVVMKIHDDEVWDRVKKGELSMLSIGGSGVRG